MVPQILILAAGSASRMRGGDKLLELVDGEPLLARLTRAALATGAPVTVTLPPDRPLRALAIADLPVTCLSVPDAARGMAASLRRGLGALPAQAGVMLLLADLPEIDASDLTCILRDWARHPDCILRGAAADGTPGHPVCFPPDLRPALLQLQGDEGARSVIAAHQSRLRLCRLPGRHAVTDLDTPEDWAAWRTARQDLTRG